MDKYQIFHALEDGKKIMDKESAVEEAAKKGVWRGGSSGCLTEDGRVLGADPRGTILRYLGIQTGHEFSQSLMFQAGHSNEDGFADMLRAGGVSFKQESECPMVAEFEHPMGPQKITGRPDFILMNDPKIISRKGSMSSNKGDVVVYSGEPPQLQEPTYQRGIELKLMCSFHSVMKYAHFVDGVPKTDHVVQAATYSNHFDIPWTLAYVSRVNWPVPYGNPSRANPEGRWTWPDHPALRKEESGRVYTILPFVSLYDLSWKDDKLFVDGQESLITGTGILNYYKYLADCVHTKTIPAKRSGHWKWNGESVPDDKNDTLRYDDFAAARTDTWDNWVADCRGIAEGTQ